METPVEKKKPKLAQFKVNFGRKALLGKSYVRVGLAQGIPHTVTGKFYTKDQYNLEPSRIENRSKKLEMLGPKEKYQECVTENQKYGWYSNVRFTDLDKNDRRVYFAKQMDHLIKLYLITMDKPEGKRDKKKN